MDPRRRFGVNQGNDHSGKEAQGHETLFVVREAIILEGESRPFKYSGCIDEVQPMLFQV